MEGGGQCACEAEAEWVEFAGWIEVYGVHGGGGVSFASGCEYEYDRVAEDTLVAGYAVRESGSFG